MKSILTFYFILDFEIFIWFSKNLFSKIVGPVKPQVYQYNWPGRRNLGGRFSALSVP